MHQGRKLQRVELLPRLLALPDLVRDEEVVVASVGLRLVQQGPFELVGIDDEVLAAVVPEDLFQDRAFAGAGWAREHNRLLLLEEIRCDRSHLINKARV
ncbi:hypothetical protein ASF89_00705 [Frigoribacterium sp. Leaf172]|nr:hypothetical protein ASF89_00705 [Frigoribacterium sp. Leaf172]